MRGRLLVSVAAIFISGCASGLPSLFAIPIDIPFKVRNNIHVLYWDAQWRAQGCLNITDLTLEDVDCSAAVPWLVALLRDDTYAWSTSIFYPHTGTPVWKEAATALYCIGGPALPALAKAAASSDVKLSRRARLVREKIKDPDSFAKRHPTGLLVADEAAATAPP